MLFAEEYDPWKPLEMHEKGSLLIRPFRQVSAVQCTPALIDKSDQDLPAGPQDL